MWYKTCRAEQPEEAKEDLCEFEPKADGENMLGDTGQHSSKNLQKRPPTVQLNCLGKMKRRSSPGCRPLQTVFRIKTQSCYNQCSESKDPELYSYNRTIFSCPG
ncbi:hypothetical protein DPMN_070651 [Dreissena polymorpha]|uniref:Uncharacterized protein n=1 Tax=Dreissena polymorpha TaxID=45954 RepID=A0A9D4BP39_DREPO|nr:hypothetical protein DPMN_070651 [Dreissena polymorpha]